MADSEIERLRDAIDCAWEEALKFGLDPFPTHFELVPASIMYEFASYGLPGRFSHWTHGKSYYRQKMQYFFFQAEDGIRDVAVTGVQTCALPICGIHASVVGIFKNKFGRIINVRKID